MARYDLSETEWRLIEPLLPNKLRGVARVDDRRVVNGIFYVRRSCHLSTTQPDRALLLQTQAVQTYRHALRQAGTQRPRRRPNRLNPNLA